MGKTLAAVMLMAYAFSAQAVKYGNNIYQSSTNYQNLVELDLGDSICSGTRVSQNYALTAAHCFRNISSSFKIKYYNGPTKITETIYKNEVIINSYDLYEELALVPLNPKYGDSTAFNAYPIYLYQSREFSAGDKFMIAGYGMNQNGNLGRLRSGSVKYVRSTHYTDESEMLVFAPLKKDEIAPGESTRQMACPGDSGGPIFHINAEGEKSLLGIVSYINSTTTDNLEKKDNLYQCKKSDRSYYVPLSLHSDFLTAHGIIL